MSKDKREALKGRKVFVYARVSTEEQTGTLETQKQAVLDALKELGFDGKPEVYAEQASGTKLDRPELTKMIEKAKASKRPAIIVVRDIQRFSRDPYDLGTLYNPLKAQDIPILSINEPIITGTRKKPQPAADLLAPILVAAGGQEVSTRLQQTLQGVEQSRARGIVAGNPLRLYPDDKIEPRREVRRHLELGIGQSEGSRRVDKSSSFWRKTRDLIRKYEDAGVLDDWLDSIDLIRKMEQEKGEGIGSKATIRMQVVRRMTSGYLNDPIKFKDNKPTQDDLMEFFNNFNQYRKKRTK